MVGYIQRADAAIGSALLVCILAHLSLLLASSPATSSLQLAAVHPAQYGATCRGKGLRTSIVGRLCSEPVCWAPNRPHPFMGLFWATSVKVQQAFLTCGFGGHWWRLRPSQYDVTGIEAKKPIFTVSSFSLFICNMGTTTVSLQPSYIHMALLLLLRAFPLGVSVSSEWEGSKYKITSCPPQAFPAPTECQLPQADHVWT